MTSLVTTSDAEEDVFVSFQIQACNLFVGLGPGQKNWWLNRNHDLSVIWFFTSTDILDLTFSDSIRPNLFSSLENEFVFL